MTKKVLAALLREKVALAALVTLRVPSSGADASRYSASRFRLAGRGGRCSNARLGESPDRRQVQPSNLGCYPTRSRAKLPDRLNG